MKIGFEVLWQYEVYFIKKSLHLQPHFNWIRYQQLHLLFKDRTNYGRKAEEDIIEC